MVCILSEKDIGFAIDISALNHSKVTRGKKEAITCLSLVCLAVNACPGDSQTAGSSTGLKLLFRSNSKRQFKDNCVPTELQSGCND